MTSICLVSYELHPVTPGGCGVYVRRAAEALLARGHAVTLLLDCPRDALARFDAEHRSSVAGADRLACHLVDELLGAAPPIPPGASRFERDSIRFMHALDALLARAPIDLVEFFDFCGPAWAYLTRRGPGPRVAPFVAVRIHGTLEVLDRACPPPRPDPERLIAHTLEGRALALADAILVPSREFAAGTLRPIYGALIDGAIVSQPPSTPLPARPRSPGDPEIAFLGRVSRLKGADDLVQAALLLMERRPDLPFRVTLIGPEGDDAPGPVVAHLKSLIPPRHAPRFHFTGPLDHDAIADRLALASLAAFPSRVESYCYALHETYDAGVPVVIRDLPAYRAFFTHDRNALVYDGAVPALAGAIERLLTDESLRARLSRPYPVERRPLGPFYDALAPAPRPADPRVAVADELGGRTLARLALRKLVRRLIS